MKKKSTQITGIQRIYLWMAKRLDAADIQQTKKTVEFFAVVVERALKKARKSCCCCESVCVATNQHSQYS